MCYYLGKTYLEWLFKLKTNTLNTTSAYLLIFFL